MTPFKVFIISLILEYYPMVQWMLVHWYWFLFWKPAYYMVMWLVPTVLGKDGSVYFEEFKGWFKSLMGLVL